jgi:hypothetical protein
VFRRIGFLLFVILFTVALSACGIAQSVLPAQTTAQANEYVTYVVQPGETASQIAARYHITIEQLIALNVGDVVEFTMCAVMNSGVVLTSTTNLQEP